MVSYKGKPGFVLLPVNSKPGLRIWGGSSRRRCDIEGQTCHNLAVLGNGLDDIAAGLNLRAIAVRT